MREAAGFGPSVASHEMLAGVRSDLNMADPDRLFHRMHHELCAQFDVGAKPLREQPLDIGQTEIRHDAGRKRHRQHEAQHD